MSAQEFLSAFNRIDHRLRELIRMEDRDRGFATVVREAANRLSLVRPFQRDLLKYAQLRNVIVHEQTDADVIIAVPHPTVVERIERIARLLESPPLAFQQAQRDVKSVDVRDPIAKPLRWTRELRLSRFPVYDGKRFVGLLTPRCIARWLASSVDEGTVRYDGVTVQQVLSHDDTRGRNVAFLTRDASIYDAQELFARVPNREQPAVEAILLTQNGRPEDALLGILTPSDLIDVLGEEA